MKKPDFHIMVCLIQIWKMKDPKKPMDIPEDCLLISEVGEIEIEDSYRKLINTALVRFPRGTVIKKTITQLNGEKYNSAISASTDDNGIVWTTRTDSKKAEVSDFEVGSRIRIMLGYTTDPKVARLTKPDSKGYSIYNDSVKLSEYKSHLSIMFDGYITKCSIDTPIEIKCEDLASSLKKKSCPNIPVSNKWTVNDFFSSKGKFKLLEGTGLKLHPETEATEITLPGIGLTTDLTVADILTTWNKAKIFSFVKDYNGEACLAIGRSYFSNAGKDSVFNFSPKNSVEILFDYHVASNNLSLMSTDKGFLALEATSLKSDGKFYRMAIRLNPDWNSSMSNRDKWQVMNEVTISKQMMKLGATHVGKSKDRIDLSTYNLIHYTSRKIGATPEQLFEEATKYFESYNMNGIEGSLTLFGDLALKSGMKVYLKDKLHPQKNGHYLLDEVVTKFGVGTGYRQTVKLPYCISREKKEGKQ